MSITDEKGWAEVERRAKRFENTGLSVGAEIFLALGLNRASKLRRIAATLVARYVMEFHKYGWNPGYNNFVKLCRRFRLGDFAEAMMVHYPMRGTR